MNLENVSLGNSQKVERVDSIAQVKSKVPLEELSENLKTTRLDHHAVKKLWQQGKLDHELFSYEETYSIKIKKK